MHEKNGPVSVSGLGSTEAVEGSLEFLTFRLGDGEYGIDIQHVNQLRGYDNVTAIANAPQYVKGVINLRGSVIQIIDFRIKLNVGERIYDQFTVVIILNVSDRTFGIVVDSVADVIRLARDQIRPPPSFDALSDTGYLKGIGTMGERILVLLDADKLMSDADESRDVAADA